MTTVSWDAGVARARRRGAERAEQVLSGSDMLADDAFAALVGASCKSVRRMAAQGRVLERNDGLGRIRFPAWQVADGGVIAPEVHALFAMFGENPWGVYLPGPASSCDRRRDAAQRA